MRIGGFHKNSFVDYPGKLAATVFTVGCNMDCSYCHNQVLLADPMTSFDINEVLRFLKARQKFLEGVVVSGGEPTLQPGLEEFISEVKRIGYAVKLDTNGTNPGVLKRLVKRELIDYVAMDIKAPLEKYQEICQADIPVRNIKKSINILMDGKVDYEFRTTFAPALTVEDIAQIGEEIQGAKRYFLQQYRIPPGSSPDAFSSKPHTPEQLYRAIQRIKHKVGQCELRGIAFCAS